MEKETNILNVIKPLDVDNCIGGEGCEIFNFKVLSTNNCNKQPEYFDEKSILNVIVRVKDINDNFPKFINVKNYYVFTTLENECKDCIIYADDDDKSKGR